MRLHLLLILLAEGILSSSAPGQSAPHTKIDLAETRLHYEADLDGALELSSQTRKPILLFFHSVSCPRCREITENALSAPAVLDIANRFHWVPVELDRHVSLARGYGVDQSPTMLVLDHEGRARVRLFGVFTPDRLADALDASVSRLRAGDVGTNRTSEVYGDVVSCSPVSIPEGYRGYATCFSQVGYGPLNLHSQSPFQALRLGIAPRPPSTLAKDQFELKTTATWVNVWALEAQKYRLDYEMLELTASLSYGLADTLQLELAFEDRSRFGGIMDGFIQGFHDLFGISQDGRDRFPKDDFAFDVDGASLSNDDRGHFRQSLSIALQHNVTCGTDVLPAIAYALTSRFKLSDAGDMHSDGLLDLGASISLARRFSDFYFYLMLGYAYFGEERFHDLDLKETQFSAAAAAEWRCLPSQSLILQYLFTEGVVQGPRPFSKPSHEVTLGWKGEVAQNVVLELGLIENIITYDNSPDFGVHAGLSWRF